MLMNSDVLSKRATDKPEAANNARTKYALFLSLQPAKEKILDVSVVYKVFTGLLDIPFVKRMFNTVAHTRFLAHLIGEHFLIISNNSYGGSLTNASSIGTVAGIMSLFNHACAPNLFNSSAANQEVCITMRPVKKGEQLFVKYLCGDRTTRERQQLLLHQWDFLCKCDKCEPHSNPVNQIFMRADPIFAKMQSLGLSQLAPLCVNFLRKFGHLPWSNELDMVLKAYTKCLLDDFPYF